MDDSSLEWDLSGKLVSTMNITEPDDDVPIKMAALGRRFQLGQLYDYKTDTLFADCLWEVNSVKWATKVDIKPKLKVQQYDHQEWSSRWQHAGLCKHLQASVMADLIGKYRGASGYVVDECDLCDALRTMRLRYKHRTERIDPSSMANGDGRSAQNIPKEATHVVVGIQYGVESFSLFSSPVAPEEAKEDVEEELKEFVDRMMYALYDKEDVADFQAQFDDLGRINRIQCKHYADLQAYSREIRFFESYKLNCKLIRTMKEDTGQAVPLSIVLVPIPRRLAPPAIQDISDVSLSNAAAIFDGLSRSRTQVQGWLKNEKIKIFQEFRNSLRQLVDCTNKFTAMLHKALNRVVPESRSPNLDSDEDDPVTSVVEMARDGIFSQVSIEDWMQRKEAEMKMLEMVGQLDGAMVVQMRSKLDAELLSSKRRCILILKLPPLAQQDPLLDGMKVYVTNNKRLTQSNPVPISNVVPWYMANDAQREMISVLSRFKEHVQVNRNDERVAFLVTSLLSQGDTSRPRLCLYEDGRCVDDYQLPSSPYDVTVVDRTDSHLILEWDCSAAESVTRYLVRYKRKSDPMWQEMKTSGNERRAKIPVNMSTRDLSIQVAAICKAGRSGYSCDFDDRPLPKKLLPPALRIGRVTHNSIEVDWLEPAHDPGMSISGYRISFHPEGNPDKAKQLETAKTTCWLVSLNVEERYVIQAVAHYGPDGESPPSGPLICSTSKKSVRFAEWLKKRCTQIGRVSDLDLLLVPLREQHGQSRDVKRFVFGTEANGQKHRRTILLVGATGSGKTTLINGMINYIFGVDWSDSFRFKLIHEQGPSQAHSQTKCVTAYDIHWADGMNIPYSLTIVDTPGYGDTKGLERDKQIADVIGQFFKDPNGIQEVDAIGFVSQASLPRLTPTQKYIFDSVLAIFGNDIKENINMMLTFADSQQPPVLEAILKAQIPCSKNDLGQPVHHKFNNSGFFASNLQRSDPVVDQFNAHFWNMGMDNFGKFFSELVQMKTKSLSLTRQVLDERKQLEATIEGLTPLIQRGLAQMEQIRKTKIEISSNQGLIDANSNVEIEVEVTEATKVDISHTGHFLTNCPKCHVTCHYPCAYQNDEDKVRCSAMTSGVCRICPKKCAWNIHSNQPYKWEYVTVTKTVSSDELKKKYENLLQRKLSAQGLMDRLEQEMQQIQNRVLESVHTVAGSIQRLEEIALRPNPFSSAEYIDLMISSELQDKKSGYKERVDSLRKLRQQADITSKISSGQSLFGSPSTAEPAASTYQPTEMDESITEEKFGILFQ